MVVAVGLVAGTAPKKWPQERRRMSRAFPAKCRIEQGASPLVPGRKTHERRLEAHECFDPFSHAHKRLWVAGAL